MTEAELGFLLAAAASIFATVDPIGTLPFFVALSEGFDEADKRVILKRAVATCGVTLVVFLVAGRFLFAAFGFTLWAMEISGGILLFLIAYDMLHGEVGKKIPPADREDAIRRRDELAIAPLGIPLLAGPGAIAMVMVLVGNSGGDVIDLAGLFVAVIAVTLASWAILHFGQGIFRYLGRVGITAIIRVMGLLLAAVGVQFIINGVVGAAGHF
ncbi:MAG: NAAT family transporter [Euryarchaeota archaeon]|nr:NAAT family transporter [Euryarchaeota archaeon]MDE1881370.1 NAAT family transporter [Euryarchaeota archaeon]MDE2045638.1 NAAT family transporter [Thermoplasmata archaeon]